MCTESQYEGMVSVRHGLLVLLEAPSSSSNRNAVWLKQLTIICFIFVMETLSTTSQQRHMHRGHLYCVDACLKTSTCSLVTYRPLYRDCHLMMDKGLKDVGTVTIPDGRIWGTNFEKDLVNRTQIKFICSRNVWNHQHIRQLICTKQGTDLYTSGPKKCSGTRPYVMHGKIVSSNATRLEYECKKLDHKTGPIFSVCQDGTWTKPSGKCKGHAVYCTSAAPDVLLAHKAKIVANRQMYECDEGYSSSGPISAMCVNNKWKNPKHKCSRYHEPEAIGTVTDEIMESSGLAASRLHPGYLYTHNDYHSEPVIFVLDAKTAELVATLTIDGAVNNDWEDIAVGVCGSKTCIYIGDIGGRSPDDKIRPANVIYRVQEPLVIVDQSLPLDSTLKFRLDYSDSHTLLLDTDGRLYIVSTHEQYLTLYKLPSTWGMDERYRANRRCSIGPCRCDDDDWMIWGGDISPDGNRLVLAHTDGYVYWDFNNGSFLDAIKNDPGVSIPSNVHKAQGLAFKYDGTGIYLLEEKTDHVLYFSRRVMWGSS